MKPKVIVLVQALGYGGGSLQTFYIIQQLVEKGSEAILITNDANTQLHQAIEDQCVPVKVYPVPFLVKRINPLADLKLLRFMLKVFRKERPQLCLSAGVKLITFTGIAGWLARVPKRVAIIRGHGSASNSLRIKFAFAIEWLLARLGMRFITVCEHDRQEMLRRRICKSNQVITVHNGTNVEFYKNVSDLSGKFRTDYFFPPDSFLIGMIGRFYPQKRYDRFVEFMAPLCQKYPHVHAVLVGDGPMRKKIEEQIARTGFADRFHFTGYFRDMAALYADLDLSVLFTDYEGCSNALLESSAAGVPMIAEDVCGNREIIEHLKSGFIVSHQAIDQAIKYAEQIIESPELRARFGKKGTIVAAERFDRNHQVDRLIQVAYSHLWQV